MFAQILQLVLCIAFFRTSGSEEVDRSLLGHFEGNVPSPGLISYQHRSLDVPAPRKTENWSHEPSPNPSKPKSTITVTAKPNTTYSNSKNAPVVRPTSPEPPKPKTTKIVATKPKITHTNSKNASLSNSRKDLANIGKDLAIISKMFKSIIPILQKAVKKPPNQTAESVSESTRNSRIPQAPVREYKGPRADYFSKFPINKSNASSHSTGETECKTTYSCSDCNTARICAPLENGTYQEVELVKCPPEAPHCDYATGTCRWQANKECLKPDDFICMSDGHFPDVDCKFYHVCNNLTSERRQCEFEDGFYNADRGHCDSLSPGCGYFDCSKREVGVKTPYTTYPNYFAYCDGQIDPLIIDKCPEATWLNMTTQACEVMCSDRDGVLQDPECSKKYYKCSRVWLSDTEWYMVKTRKDCPEGSIFDPKLLMCVAYKPSSVVPYSYSNTHRRR